uniref:Metalloprotease TIKI n=1 Tax=Crocodylus porosus TaxID=8502 RepID=A0A7M4G2R9_CROPO
MNLSTFLCPLLERVQQFARAAKTNKGHKTLADCQTLPKVPTFLRPSLISAQGDLNSFLWTIRRDPPAYLFGTIHVPYTRVWDFIPENSKAAFQASSGVYFELDLTDPYTISGLASCQMLPHGENLQDVLPRELYRRLKRHLEYVKLMLPHWMTPDQRGKGLYADYLFNAIAGNWERKRPVWVMLMVNSLTETDIRSRGVPVLDLYLAQEAERMKKTTGAVERVEEQCHPLNGLNFSQVRKAEMGSACYLSGQASHQGNSCPNLNMSFPPSFKELEKLLEWKANSIKVHGSFTGVKSWSP